MSDVGVDPGPRSHRARFSFCLVATVLFALALACDIVSEVFQPTCPPGWTRWDFEPGLALTGIPVTLLLLVSAGATLRARGVHPSPRRRVPIATLVAVILALIATLTLLIFAYSLLVQVVNPNAGCITF